MLGAGLIDQAMGSIADKREFKMNKRNQKLQIAGQKEMADYMSEKQMDLWKKTGPGGMMKELKEAGLSPGLMYGMGGAGGQTAAASGGQVSGGANANKGGNEAAVMGMGMQMELMKAQKENIEADTANKKAEAGYTGGAKTANTEQGTKTSKAEEDNKVADTAGKWNKAKETELENNVKDWLQNHDKDGTLTGIDKSVAVEGAIAEMRKVIAEGQFKMDENERQKAMNSAGLAKIASEIRLMKAKGATEAQILKNLIKDGTMKDTEIEWQNVGLTKETLGQVILGMLKRLPGK